MKINRSIIIECEEISPMFEEMNAILDTEITGIDPMTEEGHVFATKYPKLFKLYNLLQSEVMKGQTTYNYERIPG